MTSPITACDDKLSMMNVKGPVLFFFYEVEYPRFPTNMRVIANSVSHHIRRYIRSGRNCDFCFGWRILRRPAGHGRL